VSADHGWSNDIPTARQGALSIPPLALIARPGADLNVSLNPVGRIKKAATVPSAGALRSGRVAFTDQAT
jgi:hypothetical protein